MSKTLIKVENVSKKFCRNLKRSLWYGMKDLGSELLCRSQNSDGQLRKKEFWAVKDVSFELKRGECLGLIGRNGAGKTTLLRMLNGLIKPDAGRIEMHGRIGALIALGAGFNPILTGRENIYVNASVLGLSKRKIDKKIDEIIDFSEIGEFIDTPVQSYSSGMNVRLGFAVATALEPDVLIIDEVLAVGDFRFRWKCLEKIKMLRFKGVCILLVSHNSHDLMRTCDFGMFLDRGRLKAFGKIQEALHVFEKTVPETLTHQLQKYSSDWMIEEVLLDSSDVSDTPPITHNLTLHITLFAKKPLPKGRLVVGLFHSELGAIFHTSSYRDINWFSLCVGRSKVIVKFSGFILQYGTCRAEISLRGENISDIYDIKQSFNQITIRNPEPNFEGFGVNGGILPICSWSFNCELV